MITGRQLKCICPNLGIDRANYLAFVITDACERYKVNNDQLKELLANMCSETGGFTIREESMYYKSPERIVEVWPLRFSLGIRNAKSDARGYSMEPVKLANKVYNGRMGNREGSNDGWNFRGSGFLQMTGRETFQKYFDWLKWNGKEGNTLEDLVERIRTDDWYACDSAFFEFSEVLKLKDEAIGDERFREIVKKINGGYTNYKDRANYFELCKKFIV